ncbi:ion transport 2 domain protein [Striga asiatica]|uniref:Ion transport 2 domain protein n=1 Tax=Striga asiatica TaxID=4170 RepID=A0A5A7QBJ0_STRAF|nr:ion transport 2 domain protein [Striga asiatica]
MLGHVPPLTHLESGVVLVGCQAGDLVRQLTRHHLQVSTTCERVSARFRDKRAGPRVPRWAHGEEPPTVENDVRVALGFVVVGEHSPGRVAGGADRQSVPLVAAVVLDQREDDGHHQQVQVRGRNSGLGDDERGREVEPDGLEGAGRQLVEEGKGG